MNRETLRNAIEAHGWVGLVLSIPLFVVFWAGAITLFLPEVSQWASAPVISAAQPPSTPPTLLAIVEQKLASLPARKEGAIAMYFAPERSPYFQLYLPVREQDRARDENLGSYVIDPTSGATVVEHAFQLGGFLHALHFSLHLPQGMYLVGLVSLFFLVMLMTGLVIQLKNLVADFFLYRHERGKRQRLNDMHTVAGVLTLPFALLYALTGLMFNLAALFGLPVVLLAYRGDQKAAMLDIGYPDPDADEARAAGVAVPMPPLEPLIERFERENDASTKIVNLINHGDANAVIRFQGVRRSTFPHPLARMYEVETGKFRDAVATPSAQTFSTSWQFLLSLHKAIFGGAGIRGLMYLLALGICGMIVVGNLLWLAKREAKLAKHPCTSAVVRGLTVGGCVGIVVATSAGFVLERVLPASWTFRSELVQGAFVATLAVTTVAGFVAQRARPFLRRASWITAALLLVPPLVDIAYAPQLAALWERDYRGAAGVSFGLLLHAALFAWLGVALRGEDARRTANAL